MLAGTVMCLNVLFMIYALAIYFTLVRERFPLMNMAKLRNFFPTGKGGHILRCKISKSSLS